ncbi:hypothetical protein KLAE6086_11975 [Klebsiella aerogenes]|nr:Uncharacterised protein [Klebsiella aerogenes]
MALRLSDLQSVRPAFNLFTMQTETAGVGGLKIAETFPEGRGSPHGCGLRAVTCRDAASARPEACRDKSKEPRSGDFGGQSPGVQRAAATGRPLCAPCATENILHKNQTGAQYPLKRHSINVFLKRKSCKPIAVSTILQPQSPVPTKRSANRGKAAIFSAGIFPAAPAPVACRQSGDEWSESGGARASAARPSA